MGLVGALVIAGLLSTAYVRSEPAQARSALDLVEVNIAGSDLPVLPIYKIDPEIEHNVRQLTIFVLFLALNRSWGFFYAQLGGYGPRYAVPSKLPSNLPTGCNVTMINIVSIALFAF